MKRKRTNNPLMPPPGRITNPENRRQVKSNHSNLTDLMGAQKTILTHDPSMTAWGWAVVSFDGKVIDTGCIKTTPDSKKKNLRKGDDRIRRVSDIINQLTKVVEKYNCMFMVSEQPHGSQSAVAAVMIGLTLGMLQSMALCKQIPIEWYSEGDVKRELFHRQSVAKKEMQEYIRQNMDVVLDGPGYKDEAVADALGVYLTAMRQSSTLQMLSKIETNSL
jgi:Holliday junction resolvasome RuvABC endonuclease subunit